MKKIRHVIMCICLIGMISSCAVEKKVTCKKHEYVPVRSINKFDIKDFGMFMSGFFIGMWIFKK